MTKGTAIFRNTTMRDWCARGIALATGSVIVALVLLVALIRNPPGAGMGAPTAADPAQPDPGMITDATVDLRLLGEGVYDAQGCARCHRLRGKGNPSSPLDGVLDRLSPEEVRARIIASDPVRASMAARAVAAKRAYRDLTALDLDALVEYLRQAP